MIAIVKIEKGQVYLFAGFHPIHAQWAGLGENAVVWHATEEDALWNVQMMRCGANGSFYSSIGLGEIQSDPITAPLFLLRKLP